MCSTAVVEKAVTRSLFNPLALLVYQSFKSREISPFLKSSAKSRSSLFTLFYQTSASPLRCSIVVPKKIGSAVIRNRVRRRLVAAFNSLSESLNPTIDMVFIAQRRLDHFLFNDIRAIMLHCLKKEWLLQ